MTKHLRYPLAAIAFSLAVAIGGAAALAQLACGTRDSVVAKLGDQYGEVRRGRGLAGPMAIFEIWASEATGSWTILKTTPDGLACVMAAGYDWKDAVPATFAPMTAPIPPRKPNSLRGIPHIDPSSGDAA